MNLDSSFYVNGNELPLGYDIVKGYMIYFTLKYRYNSLSLCSEIYNDQEILIDYVHDYCSASQVESIHDQRIKFFNRTLFTEEELLSASKTRDETREKIEFLKERYIYNIGSSLIHKPNAHKTYEYISKYVYDPVSNVFVDKSQKDFVDKHIKLYKAVIGVNKPSLFNLVDGLYLFEDIFMTYYQCIPLADEDDSMLEYAVNYVNKNARKMALKVYETSKDSWLPMRLIKEGYIKKPTQKKLLEMANNFDDSQFAAVLLDAMKDKKKNKTKFDL